MDCPHLAEYTSFPSEVARIKDSKLQCCECSTSHSLWMCLTCGKVHCGRYVNGHALKHYEGNNDHKITLSTESASLYCYKCDNDIHVTTQNNELEQIRKSLILDEYSEGSESFEGNVKENDDSNVSAANDTRVLRSKSQKRSHSKDNEEELENKQSRKSAAKNTQQKDKEKKAVGLRNLGNTCFMNAVLQSLNNIDPFSVYIKQLPSFEKLKKNTWKDVRQLRNSKECNDVLMAEELRKILLSLNCEYQGQGRSAISPESLFLVIWKVVPRFRGYQQQDAHEFLRYMLDRLHMELLLLLPELNLKDVNIGQKGRASIITCVFGGVLQSEVRCLNCSSVSKKQDPFLDLSLDIPDKYLPKHLSTRRSSKEPADQDSPACNIFDCLSSFVEVEELAESEQYYCNNCKDKQRSTKRFWIRRLPNVLCLHLKRFRWINFYRMKLDTDVEFPVEFLDMTDFVLHDVRDTRQSCMGSNVYDLAAVIVHHGSGAGSGHYTAFAIHKGHWFHFNDSSVQQVRSSVVAKCKPYILFYIRREVRLPKLFES